MFEYDTCVIAKVREECEKWTSHLTGGETVQVSEPTQRPEGALIERLRTAIRPTLSVRAAAKAADLSASRWTQIAQGYKQETKTVRVPVRAPADTLARMARVVSATPDQLREAGREDAAAELEALPVTPSGPRPHLTGTDTGISDGSGTIALSDVQPPRLDPVAASLDGAIGPMLEMVSSILDMVGMLVLDEDSQHQLDELRRDAKRTDQILRSRIDVPEIAQIYSEEMNGHMKAARDILADYTMRTIEQSRDPAANESLGSDIDLSPPLDRDRAAAARAHIDDVFQPHRKDEDEKSQKRG